MHVPTIINCFSPYGLLSGFCMKKFKISVKYKNGYVYVQERLVWRPSYVSEKVGVNKKKRD